MITRKSKGNSGPTFLDIGITNNWKIVTENHQFTVAVHGDPLPAGGQVALTIIPYETPYEETPDDGLLDVSVKRQHTMALVYGLIDRVVAVPNQAFIDSGLTYDLIATSYGARDPGPAEGR